MGGQCASGWGRRVVKPLSPARFACPILLAVIGIVGIVFILIFEGDRMVEHCDPPEVRIFQGWLPPGV